MTRVKPRKARKNSMNEEIFDVEEEDLPISFTSKQFVIQMNKSSKWKIRDNSQYEITRSL